MKLRIAKKIYKRYSEWRDLFKGMCAPDDALAELCASAKRSSARKARRIVERKAKA